MQTARQPALRITPAIRKEIVEIIDMSEFVASQRENAVNERFGQLVYESGMQQGSSQGIESGATPSIRTTIITF